MGLVVALLAQTAGPLWALRRGKQIYLVADEETGSLEAMPAPATTPTNYPTARPSSGPSILLCDQNGIIQVARGLPPLAAELLEPLVSHGGRSRSAQTSSKHKGGWKLAADMILGYIGMRMEADPYLRDCREGRRTWSPTRFHYKCAYGFANGLSVSVLDRSLNIWGLLSSGDATAVKQSLEDTAVDWVYRWSAPSNALEEANVSDVRAELSRAEAERELVDSVSVEAHAILPEEGLVAPVAGEAGDEFTYTATVWLAPEARPGQMCLHLNGVPHTMQPVQILGVGPMVSRFQYTTRALSQENNTYHFELDASDRTWRYPESGELSGPAVTRPSFLSEGRVNPGAGTEADEFSYYVTYKHPNGAPPKWVVAEIDGGHGNGGISGSMYKVSGDFQTGAVYRSRHALPPGTHEFSFKAKLIDDTYDTYPASGTLNGPTVGRSGSLQVQIIPNYPNGRDHFEPGDTPDFDVHVTDPQGNHMDPGLDEGGYLMLSVWRYPPGQFIDVERTKLGVGYYHLRDVLHTFGNGRYHYMVRAMRDGYFTGTAAIGFVVGDVPSVDPVTIGDAQCDPSSINPGQDTSEVSYTTSATADLTVDILSNGKGLVRRLTDAAGQPAGGHSTAWDGRDGGGQFVSDGTYHCIIGARKIVKPMECITTIGPSGNGITQMQYPVDVALFGHRVYAADQTGEKVAVYDLDGAHLFNITADDIPKDAWFPVSVACSPEGAVYVLDARHPTQHEIMVFDAEGNYQRAFARGDFDHPADAVLDVDVYGNTYVGDYWTVHKYDESGGWQGELQLELGQGNRQITGLAVDRHGNIWVTHPEGELRKFDGNGTLLFTVDYNTGSPHKTDVDVREDQFVYYQGANKIRVCDLEGNPVQELACVSEGAKNGIAVDDSGLAMALGNLPSQPSWVNHISEVRDNSSADMSQLPIIVDSTPPTAVISSPADGATVDGHDGEQLEIAGRATDPEFHHYLVEWASSTAPDSWQMIHRGGQAVDGGTLATWDMSELDSGDYKVRLTVFDTSDSSNRAEAQVSYVDARPPVVQNVDPAAGTRLNGSVIVEGGTSSTDVSQIQFQCRAATAAPSSAGGKAADWVTIGSDSEYPYAAEWDTQSVAKGDYDLRAVATDTAGNVGRGDAAAVQIDNDPPSATITSPANGAELTGTVEVTASVTGDDVAGVFFEFRPDDEDVWIPVAPIDNDAPFSVEWDTGWLLPGQQYDVRAIAVDDLGNVDAKPSHITVQTLPAHEVTITDGPSGDPNPVASGEQVECSVTAEDSREGHTLTYQWTAEDVEGNAAGSFDDATLREPTWTAPDNTTDSVAEYTISVTVTCAEDDSVSDTASFTQQVEPVHEVTITDGSSGDSNPVASEGDVVCSVMAEDSLGHELVYEWTAEDGDGNPAGSFDDATLREPTWTAPENPTDSVAEYTITVTCTCAEDDSISDTASFMQQVSPVEHTVTITEDPSGDPNPVPVHFAGDVQCSVTAEDSRDGHTLTYQWTAEDGDGNLAGSFDNASLREPTWTAPENTSDALAEYTITVTATCNEDDRISDTASYTQRVNPVTHVVTITDGPSGDPNPVASGGEVDCSVTAEDSRDGHTLTYQWSAETKSSKPAGSFDDATAQNPTWTAPENTTDAVAEYTITVTATCSEDDSISDTASFMQQVEPVHEVTITDGPGGDPNPAASEAAVACSVTASDSLGHDLVYQWTAKDGEGNPAGSFDDASAQNPTWTAPVVSIPTDYTISVTANCSRDMSVSATDAFVQQVLPKVVHTFGGGKLMVGVPIEPAAGLYASMEDLLDAEAVARWDPDTQDYVTVDSPSAICALGEGCWARWSSATSVEVLGTMYTDDVFRQGVKRNWNLVALPWNENLPISAMSSAPAGEILALAWTYYGGDYHLVAPIEGIPGILTEFEPWRGYWTSAQSDCELIFDRTVAAASVETMSVGDKSQEDVWVIQLVASAYGTSDSANYCGISPRGDALDIPNPPTAWGGVDLYFTSQAGAHKALDFCAAHPGATYEWDFEVVAPAADQQVAVACPDLSSVPNDYKVYLVDRDAEKTVYMRTTSSYQYAASSEAPRHFTLRIVEEADRPLMVSRVTFQQANSTSAAMSYALSTRANVIVEVHNIAGRRVRRIVDGEPTAPGIQTVTWNLRGDGGRLVPRGLYLLRVTARAEDGRQASALAAVTVRR